MEIGQLYQFVLLLVLIGLISGIGIVCLATLENTSIVRAVPTNSTGLNAAASTTLNATIHSIGTIPGTWLGLIVVIVVMSIIIVLVIRSFGSMGSRQ